MCGHKLRIARHSDIKVGLIELPIGRLAERRLMGRSEHHRIERLNRRCMLGMLAAAGTSTWLVGCRGDSDEPELTPTPTATSAPEPTPAPTYAPITDPVPGYTDSEKWSGRTLAIAGRGGDYQDAQEEAFRVTCLWHR